MQNVSRAAVALAAIAVIAACTSSPPEDPSDPPSVPEEPSSTAEEPSSTEPPTDPADIDLGEQTWSFGPVGYEFEPVAVELSGGTAELTFNDWDGVVEMGKPTYVDLDGDEDEDVIAPLSFLADLGGGTNQWVMTDWYAWMNNDGSYEQLVYPIESAGDCADGEPSFTQAGGGGVQIEQMRLGLESACAEGATVPTSRTVDVVYDADGVAWPVQTAPTPAWGGDCPALTGSSADSWTGLVVAPGSEEEIAPGSPAVEIRDTWLHMHPPGWMLLGFYDGNQPIEAYSCGWSATG